MVSKFTMLALLLELFIGLTPSKVWALPFKANCNAMENHFNRLTWDTRVRFTGYSKEDGWFKGGMAICANGYAIEESPMGKRVCRAIITFNEEDRKFAWKPAPMTNSCRWAK
jgi:hypothetical protein